jgi:hypothetical protein
VSELKDSLCFDIRGKNETKLRCHLLGNTQTPEIDACATLEKIIGDTGALLRRQREKP